MGGGRREWYVNQGFERAVNKDGFDDWLPVHKYLALRRQAFAENCYSRLNLSRARPNHDRRRRDHRDGQAGPTTAPARTATSSAAGYGEGQKDNTYDDWNNMQWHRLRVNRRW